MAIADKWVIQRNQLSIKKWNMNLECSNRNIFAMPLLLVLVMKSAIIYLFIFIKFTQFTIQ